MVNPLFSKLDEDRYIIITGAAGFIGSGCVKYLNDQGFDNLILVDDIDGDQWKNLIGKRYKEIVPSYDILSWLEGREREIQAFIHLGACSDTTETDGEYIMENNYRFSIALAEYALNHQHTFIYASSAATYGDGNQGFDDDVQMIQSLSPLNLYGFSKHAFDLWVIGQGVLDQVVGLKYFNVYGPNESHKKRMASMVYHMYNSLASNQPIRLFMSSDLGKYQHGEQRRDFIYVKDAAKMTCEFLGSEMFGIYNIGTGQSHTFNELANATLNALGSKVPIEYIPMPADLVGKYQDFTEAEMRHYQAARKKAGLQPFEYTPMVDAVFDYVNKHLKVERIW